MRYPVFVYNTGDTVIARCPLGDEFCTAGASLSEALSKMRGKFICFMHDSEVQFEVIPVGEGGTVTGFYRRLFLANMAKRGL